MSVENIIIIFTIVEIMSENLGCIRRETPCMFDEINGLRLLHKKSLL